MVFVAQEGVVHFYGGKPEPFSNHFLIRLENEVPVEIIAWVEVRVVDLVNEDVFDKAVRCAW